MVILHLQSAASQKGAFFPTTNFLAKSEVDACARISRRTTTTMAQGKLVELERLEYLSMVSKVCTELDNHLGLNDKDLGECPIYVYLQNGIKVIPTVHTKLAVLASSKLMLTGS